MKTLIHSTHAYRSLAADGNAKTGTALILFGDEGYLRVFLKECAKAVLGGDERRRELIEKESYADCIILPARGEKFTVDTAAFVIEESLMRPMEGESKLFVLDGFQDYTPLVQNKLLKVLEEPPAGVGFLLGATAEHSVLPTVLSRARKFSVPPFPEEEVEGALRRAYGPREGIREAAAAGGGVYSVSESILLGGGGDFGLAEELLLSDPEKLCRKLGERKDKDKRSFLAALTLVVRDALLFAAGQPQYAARKTEGIRKISEKYGAGPLLKGVELAAATEREIRFNANLGQAAYAFALRLREEQAKWQR